MDAYELVITGIRCGRSALAPHLVPSGRRIIRLLEPGAWVPCESESWSSLDPSLTTGTCRRRRRTTATASGSSRSNAWVPSGE